MTQPGIGTRQEWLAARRALLDAEKAYMRQGDELARRRQELPWVPIEKDYVFETDGGRNTLAELFDGRSQLLVYHFMFGPDWELGCASCSFLADEVDGGAIHLAANDVTLLFVSRAPLEKIQAYKTRMGWGIRWVSSFGSDFNFDYGVSFTPEQIAEGAEYNFRVEKDLGDELPGLSAFALEDGVVYRTYSMYARGMDIVDNVYQLLDRAPHGRNEDEGRRDWLRRHDEY